MVLDKTKALVQFLMPLCVSIERIWNFHALCAGKLNVCLIRIEPCPVPRLSLLYLTTKIIAQPRDASSLTLAHR